VGPALFPYTTLFRSFRCALDQADFRLAGCSETAFVECPLRTVTRLARSCGPHSAGGRAHRESPGRLQQPPCPTLTPGCCRTAYRSEEHTSELQSREN